VKDDNNSAAAALMVGGCPTALAYRGWDEQVRVATDATNTVEITEKPRPALSILKNTVIDVYR
jgi:hypothetical protein